MPSPGKSAIQDLIGDIRFSLIKKPEEESEESTSSSQDSNSDEENSDENETEEVLAEPTTVLKKGSKTVESIATAMHGGWTSASPASPTTMTATFTAEFEKWIQPGKGLSSMIAIGAGIDAEVAKWIASFDPVTGTHKYALTAKVLKDSMLSGSLIDSGAMDAVSETCAEAFVAEFDITSG